VPGDEVNFEDNQDNDKMGEFPSQWDLYSGNAEIATINDKKVISMDGKDAWIDPLMKTPKNYLGDVFTLEFDFFQGTNNDYGYATRFELDFNP
jgi:hypothetical protein